MNGLTQTEVIAKRQAGQGNNVTLETSRSYLQIFQENLLTFINFVFFTLSVLLIFLGRTGDALLVGVVILGGVVVSVMQEVWAKHQLDQIALLTRPKATVIREGKTQNIDPKEIVLDDILLLQTGDQIVVDGEVVGEGSVEVDESLLTGESDAITKQLGDIVYSGSICTSGRTYYQAKKVGKASFAYRMSADARKFRQVYTPLQIEINLVIRIFLLLATFLWILVGIAVLTGFLTFSDGVQRAAVIAGLVPSGLYLSITLAYAVGAVGMIGQAVLIQKANAVESLSNVDVLCLDKTGTLTANRIYLQEIFPFGGSVGKVKEILGDYAANVGGRNATIDAIAVSCLGQKRQVLGEVPFSSSRKWSALAFSEGVYVLGAPEMVLKSPLPPKIKEHLDTFTQEGLRVLLFAFAETSSLPSPDKITEFPVTPLALVSFRDELRPQVQQTLAGFTQGGITIKIISGDNPHTVANIAKQVGLGNEIKAISGVELAQLEEMDWRNAIAENTIFGRITPEQKAKLVQTLRQQGHYVAMIGDGVNDVLSLKQANLSIAMESGSKATRNVADIVLLKDSFGSLPTAFLEGQRIRNGIQDILKLFMVRVFCVTLIIFATGQVLGTFPLLNKHSAVVTLLAVGVPTFCIPLWAKPGKLPKGSIIRSLLHFTLPATLSITLFSLAVYFSYLVKVLWEATATGSASLDNEILAIPRTALVTMLVLCELLLIPFLKPPLSLWVGGEKLCKDWRYTGVALLSIGCYFFIVAVPVMREFFELALLSKTDYFIISGLSLLWCIVLRYLWRSKLLDRFLGVKLINN